MHTDDTSLPDLVNASDRLNQISLVAQPMGKHYSDLDSDTSSPKQNFCNRFSDVISRRNQW